MIRFGFKKNKIKIISEGIELEPVADLNIEKFKKPTLLSLGALRAMKRADQIILAFELVKKDLPDLQLVVAGCTKGKFVRKVLAMIEWSPFKDSIQYAEQAFSASMGLIQNINVEQAATTTPSASPTSTVVELH